MLFLISDINRKDRREPGASILPFFFLIKIEIIAK